VSSSHEHVARISQLRNRIDHRNFVRDVHARYLLSCRCKTIPITGLIDAFVCTSSSNTYGVTITDRYDGTPVHHLLSLRSNRQRKLFVVDLGVQLTQIVSKMHACGIVHRDLHQGNILIRRARLVSPVLRIVLTDFESAGGAYFGTSDREFTAYTFSDVSAVREIIAELETICHYLDGTLQSLDTHLLRSLDITLKDLRNIRDISNSFGSSLS
jgi:serine/threonine protein kinase